MPSPFPGMNPYIEQADAWVDFHNKFINTLADWVNERTGDDYFAKVEDQIYIHELPPDLWRPLGRADVAVKPSAPTKSSFAMAGGIAAPVRAQLVDAIDTVSLPYLEIHDRRQREVVTVIELLSPSNKRPGPDRDQYARKRLRLMGSQVNFIEIDLLRGGLRHSFRDPLPPCDYYVMVYHPADWPFAGIWPINLKNSLPLISIPLRADDAPIPFDVQQHLHVIYDRGKYRAYIYNGQPDPPLSPEDAAWAQQFVPPRS